MLRCATCASNALEGAQGLAPAPSAALEPTQSAQPARCRWTWALFVGAVALLLVAAVVAPGLLSLWFAPPKTPE